MRCWMKVLFLALALVFASQEAFAQREGRKHDRRQMDREERQRMREDLRDFNRERGDRGHRPPQRQMTPQERDKLRRDVEDANRNLRR